MQVSRWPLIILIGTVGCAALQLHSTKDDKAPSAPFKKPLVCVFADDSPGREKVERRTTGAVVKSGVPAVACLDGLPASMNLTTLALIQKIQRDNYDSLIVFERKILIEAPSGAADAVFPRNLTEFLENYRSYRQPSTPPFKPVVLEGDALGRNQLVRAQVAVYAIATGRLVWKALSEPSSPKKMEAEPFLNTLAQQSVKQLMRDGLLVPDKTSSGSTRPIDISIYP